MSTLQRISGVVAAAVMTTAMLLGLASPASAATKSVTISMGDWNCRINNQYSGTVTRVLIDVVPSNSPAVGWINGRSRNVSVIYTPSGSSVKIAAVVFCKTSWWGGGYYREIAAGRWVNSSTGTYWNI